MLSEKGRIIAVEADSLWLETIRTSSCSSCSARNSCGHGLMNKMGREHCHQLEVPLGDFSAEECQVGGQAEIAIPEQLLVRGAMLVYILPLIMLMLGAALGNWLKPTDLYAFIGAALGLLLGFGLIRLHALTLNNRESVRPRLVAVYPLSAAASADSAGLAHPPV